MAYGIAVYGSNSSNLQIDSDQKLSYFQIIASGTANSVVVSNANALVFIAPTAASTEIYTANLALGGPFNTAVGTGTYNFISTSGASATVKYFVAVPVYTASVTPSGYGIAIYNSLGNLAFSSSAFVSGGSTGARFDILDVKTSADNISGNYNLASSIVYSGTDYLSVYSLVTGAAWGVGSLGIYADYIQGYRYNNNEIRFCSCEAVIGTNPLTISTAYTLVYSIIGKLV